MPFAQSGLEADVVNGTFRPDQVERTGFEKRISHRAYQAGDLIGKPERTHPRVQSGDHLRQKIHGSDMSGSMCRQVGRLFSRTTTHIDDTGIRGKFADQVERLEGLPGTAGALARHFFEKFGDEFQVEIGDLFMVVHVLFNFLRTGRPPFSSYGEGRSFRNDKYNENPFRESPENQTKR